MRLKLHDDWKWIVSHAWSFRFLILAAVLTGAEAALPLLVDHSPVPRRIFAAVMFLVVSGALIARLIVQQKPPELFPIPVPAPAAPQPVAAPVVVPAPVTAAPEPATAPAPVAVPAPAVAQ